MRSKFITPFFVYRNLFLISDVISSFDDFDEQNYEIAKCIFEQEEGRKPNMNDTQDMNVVIQLIWKNLK